MSQEAEKVSELLKHDGKGNNESEKVTNSPYYQMRSLESVHFRSVGE